MENIKKNPLSLQLNAEDFLPASNEEKQSLVVMRESVNFWKDGIRRLKKNKIAMVSFVFIIAIAIFAYLLPCLLYTSPSPRDMRRSRMPSSA